jgi:cobalt-zinc-cadmium efflux system protein
MAHDHSDHQHLHAPASFGRAFAIGIILNTGFVLIEGGYGIASNSMALLADAGHNLSDVFGLVVAWVAAILSKRAPSHRFTYGLRGSSILAALFNAVVLLIAVGAIGWEAISRLVAPEPVAGKTVIVVATIGIFVNGITAWLFASGKKADLNIRGAYLHMAADAAVSAGVVLAGLLILFTGWSWLDPITSLLIVSVIVWSTWGLLRDSVAMSLAAVPEGIDRHEVERFLLSRQGVSEFHDLHIWHMSTTEIALTTHLVMAGGSGGDEFLLRTCHELKERYGIAHSTIQIETNGEMCPLAPAHTV